MKVTNKDLAGCHLGEVTIYPLW